MTHSTRRLAFGFAFSAALASAWPARADEPSELEALVEEKVVTSASKAAESTQSAPATAITVTAEDLVRHGIRTVAEAVRYLVPAAAFEEIPNGSFGSRGVLLPFDYGAHVLVLVDGHSVNSEIDGSADLAGGLGMPIELVDHVEVVLGPGSVLYGSNAMFGVVNVVSKRAQDFHGVHLGADAEVSRQYRAFAGAGGKFELLGHKLEITVGIEHARLDDPTWIKDQYVGNDVYTGAPLRTRPDGSRNGIWGGLWTSYYAHRTAGYARANIGDFQLTTRAGTQDTNDPVTVFDFDNPDTGFRDRWLSAGLSYQKRVLAPLQIKLRLYGDERRKRIIWRSSAPQFCLPGQLSGCHIDTDAGAEWVGLEAQAHIDWMGALAQSTLIGIDGRLRNQQYVGNITDAETGANPGSVSYFSRVNEVIGAYAEHVVHPARSLTLNLGTRFDASSGSATAFSPRAALVYEPWEGGVIKAIYSSAFNAASATTLAYALPLLIIPPKKIDHERVRSFELSAEQRLGTHTLRTNLFYAHWENMIELVQLSAAELRDEKAAGHLLAFVPQAFQYRNASSIESYGFTTSVEGTALGRSLRYGASLTEAFARHVEGDQREQIAGAPELSATARASYDFGEPWPTLGVATFAVNRVLVYGVDQSNYPAPPSIAPRVVGLVNVSGGMPGLQKLRYRLGVSLASHSDSPTSIGIVKQATPENPSPTLLPLRTFTLLGGLAYTFE